MGYYTKFDLTVSNSYDDACNYNDNLSNDEELKVRKRLGEISGLYDSDASEEEIFDFFDWDTHKWYDHNIDMIKLSSEYPEYWFVLSGEGEERDDMWIELYHNSLYQRKNAIITYPEFTETEWENENEKRR